MAKKSIYILMCGFCVCLAAWLYAGAQNTPEPGVVLLERLAKIEARLEALATSQNSVQRELVSKLDRVLNTQDEILKQLEIVKVRATRK